MSVDQPGEFVSEPFEMKDGGVLTVQTQARPSFPCGAVEFRLEGSEDKVHWADLTAGTASGGERVEVPCRERAAPWGRVRILTAGEDTSVSVRWVGTSRGGSRRSRAQKRRSPRRRPAAERNQWPRPRSA